MTKRQSGILPTGQRQSPASDTSQGAIASSRQCKCAELSRRASDTKSILDLLKPPVLGCNLVASGLRHQSDPVRAESPMQGCRTVTSVQRH